MLYTTKVEVGDPDYDLTGLVLNFLMKPVMKPLAAFLLRLTFPCSRIPSWIMDDRLLFKCHLGESGWAGDDDIEEVGDGEVEQEAIGEVA